MLSGRRIFIRQFDKLYNPAARKSVYPVAVFFKEKRSILKHPVQFRTAADDCDERRKIVASFGFVIGLPRLTPFH